MMVGEIVAGSFFGSMALLADGWHMGTHAAALGIAGAAYLFARRQSGNARFSFGTGKFGDLAAFSSALILGMIAIQIAYESVLRLISPVPIAYGEAIAVACLGLAVNLVSAWLLRDSHDHHHGHAHSHDHDHDHDHHHHRDNNFRAAYVHVLADAATSVLAIAALVIAMSSGWTWTDPAVGLIGSVVIASWAYDADPRCRQRAARRVLRQAAWNAPSARGWRRATTASPICMSGSSVPAIAPPSSRWCRMRRCSPRSTRSGCTT